MLHRVTGQIRHAHMCEGRVVRASWQYILNLVDSSIFSVELTEKQLTNVLQHGKHKIKRTSVVEVECASGTGALTQFQREGA